MCHRNIPCSFIEIPLERFVGDILTILEFYTFYQPERFILPFGMHTDHRGILLKCRFLGEAWDSVFLTSHQIMSVVLFCRTADWDHSLKTEECYIFCLIVSKMPSFIKLTNRAFRLTLRRLIVSHMLMRMQNNWNSHALLVEV